MKDNFMMIFSIALNLVLVLYVAHFRIRSARSLAEAAELRAALVEEHIASDAVVSCKPDDATSTLESAHVRWVRAHIALDAIARRLAGEGQ